MKHHKRLVEEVISAILVAGLVTGLAGGCGPSSDGLGNGNGDGGVLPDAGPGHDGQVIYWDGSPGDGMVGCYPQNFTLQQAPPPAVMLVIDRSGSMLEQGSTGQSKWAELNLAAGTVLSQFESQIQFGLLMYPSGDMCTTPPAQVPPGVHHLAPITYELGATMPSGGTPTAAALRNAGQTLADMNPGDIQFIILATDGGPNCNYFQPMPCTCSLSVADYCCTSHPDACVAGHFCLDDYETLAVMSDLSQNRQIDTFVIGLDGTQAYVELLNDMATAGGRPQVGGATDYYNATSQAELTAALGVIAGSVLSCAIPLEEPPDLPDAVHIYVDGVEVPRDTTQENGWDYTDASLTEITLFGAACDNLQNGDEHQVTATFACVLD
jgi:hypothetical protein